MLIEVIVVYKKYKENELTSQIAHYIAHGPNLSCVGSFMACRYKISPVSSDGALSRQPLLQPSSPNPTLMAQ